jgi:hypothetical protein
MNDAIEHVDKVKYLGILIDEKMSFEKHINFIINWKFRVTTEIGSTFFGCWSVTRQLKK